MVLREEKAKSFDWGGIVSLIAGLPLAIGLYFVPILRHIFAYFGVLIHEFGHSLFFWLFGIPSVPSFDFTYGGGLAVPTGDRSMFIVGIVYILIIIFLILLITHRKILFLFIALFGTGLYSLAAFTSFYEIVIYFMGHGFELVFAGICFYRTLSCRGIVTPLERPLYAIVGFFLEINAIVFAWKLLTDPVEKIMYEQGMAKGGMENDFVAIGRLSHCDMKYIVMFFLFCCLLPPVVSLVIYLINRFFGEEEM